MANRAAPTLMLRDGDRGKLVRLTRSTAARAGLSLRVWIVLAAADGCAKERASKATVLKWRERYQAKGLPGLQDEPRSGRPRRLDHREIVAATLKPPPKNYGVTHWSSRLLGW